MGEALRDAYALACVELDTACDALRAAQARVEAAREQCAILEARLGMTTLSDDSFPQLPDESAESSCMPVPDRLKRHR